MLKRLFIDNFRCLTNFEMKPGGVAALVGPNGSGKSTVFELFRSLQGLLTGGGTAFDHFPPGTLTRWDSRREQRIELDVVVDGVEYSYSLEISHDPGQRGAVVRDERLTSSGDLLYRLVDGEVQLYGDDAPKTPLNTFPFNAKRSFLLFLEPRPDTQRISAFKRWMSGLWLFSLRPHAIDPTSVQESEAIADSGANYVSWYRALVQAEPEVAARVRNDLIPIIPGLAAIRLQKLGLDSRLMILECELGSRSFGLSVNELSDGQRTLLVLYTVLHALAARTSLLIFDEPDNFVAREEIQPWLSSIRDAVVDANRGTLLVISHHPEVIDYLAAHQVLCFSRTADGPARLRELDVDRDKGISASEWLMLGAGDGCR